ncbi:aldehyde dehydrogenase family protein [Rhizobium sp. NLR22b]|nr:aldehyde dehydrogenase family protein [Rhizobium sp. NLR22b]
MSASSATCAGAGVTREDESRVPTPLMIDALGPDKPYRSRKRGLICDVSGQNVAELTHVPALYMARTLDRLRSESGVAATLTLAERDKLLQQAALNFETARLGGIGPEEHHRLVALTSGLPVSVVRAGAATVADACRGAVKTVESARPQASVLSRLDIAPGSAAAVWRRRGRVLGVNASGNHPAVHSLWLEALALGYRVVVRPSHRDPLTAYRLVLALRAAGFANDDVLFLPCDYGVADELVRGVDLAIVFGGDAVVSRYAGGWLNTPVLPQGPGRVKVLITGRWEPFLDLVVESVSGIGGASCLNATGVLIEQNAPEFAEALADRLSHLRPLPPDHEMAELPCRPIAEARTLEAFLRQRAGNAVSLLGHAGIVHDFGNGSAALLPAVHLVHSATAEQLAIELPFPCAWVAPWSRSQGTLPLRDSLVVGVATDDDALFAALVEEPSIRNIYALDRPTWWLPPGIPHDGFLAEFLMRSAAVARPQEGR